MRVCSGLSAHAIAVIVIALVFALIFAMHGEVSSADSVSSDSAPPKPGTVITYANWQQYKQFMPPAMQALFTGEHFWKLPADVQLEVGPTIPMPLPPAYIADTEKNASRVTLKKLPDAGYIPQGYVTGMPFPIRLARRRSRRMRFFTTSIITTIHGFSDPSSVTIRMTLTAISLPADRPTSST